jgi:hypothetical protein
MKIFVSHIREEKTAAVALKARLEAALPGVTVWVSSVDLGPGTPWLQTLETHLKGAKAVIVLCSRQSAGKPWINFEGGFGHGKHLPVIPVCHRGLQRGKLPHPMSIFQSCDVADPDDCAALVTRLATILGAEVAESFNPATITRALEPKLDRQHAIGIMLAHRQEEWVMKGESLFRKPASLPAILWDRWNFQPILSEDKIAAAELGNLSGMIVGSPWRSTISSESIDELVDWVHGGGRMLLLGFELGDRQ